MTVAHRRRAILEYAILVSILLHATIAYFIPAFSGLGSETTPDFISVARIQPIRIQRPPPRPVKPLPRVQVPIAHPVPARASVTVSARLPRSTNRAAVRAVALPGAIVAAPRSIVAATPTSKPTATPVATAPSQPQGYLPFGVEQRYPVLDPNVQAALASLGVHVTLIVTVGDDGHTLTVVFHPPIDANMEAKIRAMLADANWDPSVCGAGLPCRGKATISL